MIDKSKHLPASIMQRRAALIRSARPTYNSRAERNAMPGCIYGLYDPVTDELRYVGMTIGLPTVRLARHFADIKRLARRDPDARAWHERLKKLNKPPVMRLIEEVTTGILDAEIYWILRFVHEGYNLVNVQHHPHKRSARAILKGTNRPGYDTERVRSLESTFAFLSYVPKPVEKVLKVNNDAKLELMILDQIRIADCTKNYDRSLYVKIALAAYKTGEDGIEFKKVSQKFSHFYGKEQVHGAARVLRSCGIIKQVRSKATKWWDKHDYMPWDYCPLVHSEFHREWMGDIIELRWGR